MSETDMIIKSLKNSGKKVEEFYMSNKTSDKNVANDSVIAHKFAVMQQQINEKDKRIQELEKENADLKKYNKTVSDRIVEYKKNSIPTQVVIDEIDKHNEKIEKYNEYREQGKETDVEYYENIANTAIVQVLQELLGGEK